MLPPSSHVPFSWFLATSTVCSAPQIPIILQIGTGHGVRCVFRPTATRAFRSERRSARPVVNSRREPRTGLEAAQRKPFEGLILVDSRTASLRPSALLPFCPTDTAFAASVGMVTLHLLTETSRYSGPRPLDR